MTSDFLEPPPIPFNPFSKEGEIMVFLTSNLEDLLVFPGQPETTLTAAEPDDTPSLLDDAKESSPKEKKEPAKPAK